MFLFKLNCSATIVLPPFDLYLEPRSKGMGGAFSAGVDDSNAIFFNPAAIGIEQKRSKSKSFLKEASFPNLTYSSNMYTLKLLKNYFNNEERYPTEKAEDSVKNAGISDIVFTRSTFFPTFVVPHFQFGFLVDILLTGYTSTVSPPQTSAFSSPSTYDRTFTTVSRNQLGPAVGFSFPIFSTESTLGLGLRYLQRATFIGDIEGNSDGFIKSSSNAVKNNINRTEGAALDLGLLMPLRFSTFNMKLAGVAQDVGDSNFSPANPSSENEIEKMNIKGGFSIIPTLSRNSSLLLSFDVERINDSRIINRNKIRVGSELNLGGLAYKDALLTFRTGYSMGMPSGGIALSLLFAKVEFSTYGEAVERKDGQTISDRRYVMRLTVDLSQ